MHCGGTGRCGGGGGGGAPIGGGCPGAAGSILGRPTEDFGKKRKNRSDSDVCFETVRQIVRLRL